MLSGMAILDMPRPRRSGDAVKVGERLRALRERLDLTQEEAGKKIGISTDGYRHWEHGRSDGILRHLDATASAFGLSIGELLIELGFVARTDVPSSAIDVEKLSLPLWRRWLLQEYSPEVALAVTRLLEGAENFNEEEVKWIAENVQRSIDLVRPKSRGASNTTEH